MVFRPECDPFTNCHAQDGNGKKDENQNDKNQARKGKLSVHIFIPPENLFCILYTKARKDLARGG